jgi:hypothetical protein
MMLKDSKWRRRGLLLGALGVMVGGLAVGWRNLFAKHYPPTPYDDVLKRLVDRQWAEKFGMSALKTMPGFSASAGAAQLRTMLGSGSLAAAASRDAAAGQVTEVEGWLVPKSVALIAALAAKLA